MKNNHLALVAVLSGLLGALAPSRAGAASYHLLNTISIGGEGGWDYLSINSAAHQLYISHATKVVVIDTEKNAIIGEIADTPGIHGVIAVPALHRIFTSNGRENTVSVVDAQTFKTVSKLHAGTNPDAILFEPTRGEIYAFNGRSHDVSIFAAADGKSVATLPLDGKPEFGVAEPAAKRVYVNLEDKSAIAAIDPETHRVLAQWSLEPGDSPTGLALDAEHHRLFAGCENEMIVVLDSADGKKIGTIPAGAGIDAVAFDPGSQLVFASNGRDGTVTIAHEDTPDKFTVVQTLKTALGARTMTVDTTTHRIYLATADFAESGMRGPARFVKDSFRVLVYGVE